MHKEVYDYLITQGFTDTISREDAFYQNEKTKRIENWGMSHKLEKRISNPDGEFINYESHFWENFKSRGDYFVIEVGCLELKLYLPSNIDKMSIENQIKMLDKFLNDNPLIKYIEQICRS